jgi:AhpD family alkylhydroperoxidase
MDGSRLAVRVLQGACGALWGFPPAIVPLIVERLGPVAAMRWFLVNMPRFLLTMRALGRVRVHLACVVVSLRNGCLYCAHGHVYALELLHLRDRGRLFPIDARRLESWSGLDDRVLRRRLHGALAEAGLHVEALWADRILALATGTPPIDADEARLAHVISMVEIMNTIADEGGACNDEAHDPVNKDAAVKREHAALRAAATPV